MRKHIRPVVSEVVCLLTCFLLTVLTVCILFNWNYKQETIDVQIYDTYFVISSNLLLTSVFLFLTFIIYYIRSISNGFSKPFINSLLVLSGIGVLYELTSFNNGVLNEGGTVFPPLSPASEDKSDSFNLSEALTNVFSTAQILVIIALLYAVYQWRKLNTKNPTDKHG